MKNKMKWATLILLTLSFTAMAADNFYQKGLRSVRQGKLYSAIVFFQKALNRNPKNIKAHLNLASAYYRLRDRDKAEKVMNDVIQIHPFSLEANFNMALMYKKSNQLRTAAYYFEKVIKLRPSEFGAHYQLAQIYKSLGNYKKAKHYFHYITGERPNDISLNLGYSSPLYVGI